ncbi:MAG: UvrD-helicase domain-containing protein [Acidaminococcus sp.]|jgi:ATP-dependent exoDNAse (exonuclease V) beta subunit|nr:UvrD-helicase domain-containing protein [Acidaminococcus sp.]
MDDSIARKRIQTETNKNFFVEAGAGSGKTTMLVKRMVAMVKSGIPVNQICAITFTKTAAREFYERFQQALSEEKGDPKCEEALKNIDLCFLGTIDSFCSKILSEHPVEAGIPSDVHLADDEEMQRYYRQIYVRICQGKEGSELAEKAKKFRTLFWNPEQAFADSMKVLMEHRDAEFQHLPKAPDNAVLKNLKDECLSFLETLQANEIEMKYTGEKGSQAAWEKLSVSLQTLQGEWSEHLADVIQALKDIKNLRTVFPFSIKLNEKFLKDKTKNSKILNLETLMNPLENYRYDVAMDFLSDCIPVCEKYLHSHGVMTYFDYLYDLRNMLREDAQNGGKLINYIAERHSYFLIDEFQDTNPLQAEIFFYLAAKHPDTDWTKCVPRPGSLFIVGDPKQSIYRFRSADVDSFRKVKNLFNNNSVGEVLQLTSNFRSTYKLCDYFNRTFEALFPKEKNLFQEIPLDDKQSETDPSVLDGVYTYKSTLGDKKTKPTDAEKVLQIIETIVGSPKFQIRDTKSREKREIHYDDIMVITAEKKQISSFIPLCKEKGIPLYVEGSVPFDDCPSLTAVADICRAVASPQDKMALYRAVTGPAFAVSEKDVGEYIKQGRPFSLFEKDFPDKDAVSEALKQLRGFYELGRTVSPAAFLAKILNSSPIFHHVSSANMNVTYYAMELVRSDFQSGEVTSLFDVSKRLDRLLDGSSEEERCLDLVEKPAVHIANLHKVKGLEAPIVILAGAKTGNNKGSSLHIDYSAQPTKGYLFSVNGMGEHNTPWFQTKLFDSEKDKETTSLNEEKDRHLYVAATRAKNVLIINQLDKKSKWEKLLKGTESDSSDIFEIIGNEAERKDTAKEAEKDTVSITDVSKAEVPWKDDTFDKTYDIKQPSDIKQDPEDEKANKPAPSAAGSTPGAPDSNAHSALQAIFDGRRVNHAAMGTMVHRLMELLVTSHWKLTGDKAVSIVMAELGDTVPEDEKERYQKVLQKVAETMLNDDGYPQANGSVQDLFTELKSAEEVHCEIPFCYQEKENHKLWNGTIDLLYKKNGGWHIVDYKTNLDGSGLDEQYRTQLEAYRKAFKEIVGEDADTRIYHIELG